MIPEGDFYWTLGNALWGFHIFYIVALGLGTFLAAFGVLRRFRRLSFVLFLNLGGVMLWQVLPGCPLNDIETWLRRHVDPTWKSGTPLPEVISERITGVDLPYELFVALGLMWMAVSVFAFWRTYFPNVSPYTLWRRTASRLLPLHQS